MDQIVDTLQQLPAVPWATAVQLGAGHGGALPALRKLQAKRLVLIEGDPDAQVRLAQHSDPTAGISVQGVAISAEGGSALWHRYTLGALNGLLDASAWEKVYPRLRLISSVAVDTKPVADVLEQSLEGSQTKGPNLLVLDVPGQEDRLLATVPCELLHRFEWIIVRGCATPPSTDWSAADAAIARLCAIGYELQPAQAAADALWPVATLRLDSKTFRLLQQEQRCNHLTTELTSAQALHQSVQADWQAAQQRVAALEKALSDAKASAQTDAHQLGSELDALARNRDLLLTQRDGLAKALADSNTARDEQAKLAAERQQRTDALSQQVAQLTSERDALAKARAEITAARDEQAKLAAERQQRTDALAQQVAQLSSERDALAKARAEITTARDEQAKLAAERQQRIDAAIKDKALLSTERDTLAKERTALVAARDEQTKAAREARQKLATLEAEMAEIVARHGLLQEELIKAEAQIELIADLLLREARA